MTGGIWRNSIQIAWPASRSIPIRTWLRHQSTSTPHTSIPQSNTLLSTTDTNHHYSRRSGSKSSINSSCSSKPSLGNCSARMTTTCVALLTMMDQDIGAKRPQPFTRTHFIITKHLSQQVLINNKQDQRWHVKTLSQPQSKKQGASPDFRS